MRAIGDLSLSAAAAPPGTDSDDELGVESPCDCGAHGANQAQFRFESQGGGTSYWQQASRFA